MTLAGQLRAAMPGGAVALSRHQVLDDGARGALLLEPDVFRFDVEPHEDTIRTHVRALGGQQIDWGDRGSSGAPIVLDEATARALADRLPLRISLSFTIGRPGDDDGQAAVGVVLAVTPLPDTRFEILGQAILRRTEAAR